MNNNGDAISEQATRPVYEFRLFITGASPNSSRAITNLTTIFDKLLKKNYTMEIIDVYQHVNLAQQENIIALPMLVKKFPLPEKRLIGDMSDIEKLINILGLEKHEHENK